MSVQPHSPLPEQRGATRGGANGNSSQKHERSSHNQRTACKSDVHHTLRLRVTPGRNRLLERKIRLRCHGCMLLRYTRRFAWTIRLIVFETCSTSALLIPG